MNTASFPAAGHFDDLVRYTQALTSHLKLCMGATGSSFSLRLRNGLWQEAMAMVDLFRLSLATDEILMLRGMRATTRHEHRTCKAMTIDKLSSLV